MLKNWELNAMIRSSLPRLQSTADFVKNYLKNMTSAQPAVFFYSLVMDSYSMGYTATGYSDMPINHKIFLAQFDTIKKMADEGPCVIIGRCADYALEDYPNVVSVFITGDEADKIKRVSELYNVDEAKAKDLMIKTDKRRSSYYNYYSNKNGAIQRAMICDQQQRCRTGRCR